MFFQRVKTPGLGHNAYVLGCGDGLAVVVDPRRDVDEYLQLACKNNLSIAYVLETHRQEDFEFGSRELAQRTGAKIVGGRHELFGDIDVKLGDGEALTVGATRIVALETPGHTPESVSYAVYVKDGGDKCWGVFSGDALFVGDTGRTDLPDPDRTGENAGVLYDAVHRKIGPLGEQTLLYPAHGSGSACGGNISARDASTLGIEMVTNPVFTMDRSDFIEHKLAEEMARPPYFRHMEEVNLRSGRPAESPLRVRVLQPKDFEARMNDGIVIDTRTPEAFAAAHILSSYNIWLAGIPAMGGWIADENSRIFLVVSEPADVETAVRSFARIGIDGIEGVLTGGVEGWREQGLPIGQIATTSAGDTAERRKHGELHILDVRDEYEWNEKRIPGALHCYVGYLEGQLPELPEDAEIVVHCSVGHRSGVAASILARNGFTRVCNMLGGITAWESLGLPLEKGADATQER